MRGHTAQVRTVSGMTTYEASLSGVAAASSSEPPVLLLFGLGLMLLAVVVLLPLWHFRAENGKRRLRKTLGGAAHFVGASGLVVVVIGIAQFVPATAPISCESLPPALACASGP